MTTQTLVQDAAGADTLLRHFDVMAQAPGGMERLREVVLQLALRGKLVPQDPNDELASVLLDRARRKQAQLIENGGITRPKKADQLIESDAPFPVPATWSWARLGEIVAVLDSRRQPVKAADRKVRTAGKPESELVPYYGATRQVGWIDDFLFNEELVLLGEDGAPFFRAGKNVSYVIYGKSWVNNHVHVLRALSGISNRYLSHVLNLADYHGFVTGTTRPKLTQGKMVNLPIPLPPAPEQHRIVAQVDQLMTLCDELEERQRRHADKRTRLNQASLNRLTTAEDDMGVAVHWRRVRENFEVLYDTPDTVADLREGGSTAGGPGEAGATGPER